MPWRAVRRARAAATFRRRSAQVDSTRPARLPAGVRGTFPSKSRADRELLTGCPLATGSLACLPLRAIPRVQAVPMGSQIEQLINQISAIGRAFQLRASRI